MGQGVGVSAHADAQGDQLVGDLMAFGRFPEHPLIEELSVRKIPHRDRPLGHQVRELHRSVVIVGPEFEILLEVDDCLVGLALLGRVVRLPQERIRHATGLDLVQNRQSTEQGDRRDRKCKSSFVFNVGMAARP